jgi:CDI immunity proteins
MRCAARQAPLTRRRWAANQNREGEAIVPKILEQSFNDLGIGWNPNNQPITKTLQAIKELCAKPIGALTSEDLLIATNHRLNLEYLLPILTARLRDAPLIAGDQYPGDVLLAALSVPINEWQGQPKEVAELKEIAEAAMPVMKDRKFQEYAELDAAYQSFADALASR